MERIKSFDDFKNMLPKTRVMIISSGNSQSFNFCSISPCGRIAILQSRGNELVFKGIHEVDFERKPKYPDLYVILSWWDNGDYESKKVGHFMEHQLSHEINKVKSIYFNKD